MTNIMVPDTIEGWTENGSNPNIRNLTADITGSIPSNRLYLVKGTIAIVLESRDKLHNFCRFSIFVTQVPEGFPDELIQYRRYSLILKSGSREHVSERDLEACLRDVGSAGLEGTVGVHYHRRGDAKVVNHLSVPKYFAAVVKNGLVKDFRRYDSQAAKNMA